MKDPAGFERVPELMGVESKSLVSLHPRALGNVLFEPWNREQSEKRIFAVAYRMAHGVQKVSLATGGEAEREFEIVFAKTLKQLAIPTPTPTPPPPPKISGTLEWIKSEAPLAALVGETPDGLLLYPVQEQPEVAVYDPKTKRFRTMGPLPIENSFHTLHGNYFVIFDPQTREGQAWDVTIRERVSRFQINTPHPPVGLLPHPENEHQVLAIVYDETERIDRREPPPANMWAVDIRDGSTHGVFARLPRGVVRPANVLGFSSDLSQILFEGGRISRDKSGPSLVERVDGNYHPFTLWDSSERPIHFPSGWIEFFHGSLYPSDTSSSYGRKLYPTLDEDFLIQATTRNQWLLLDPVEGRMLAELELPLPVDDSGQKLRFHVNSFKDLRYRMKNGQFVMSHPKGEGVFVGKVEPESLVRADGPVPFFLRRPPPNVLVPGETWSHTPEFTVAEGLPAPSITPLYPEGLRLGEKGELLWDVPDNHLGAMEIRFNVQVGEHRHETKMWVLPGRRNEDGEIHRLPQVPEFESSHQYVGLGGKVDHMLPAANGNVLLCYVPDQKVWRVVDLATLTHSGDLDLPENVDAVAAGKHRAVAYLENTDRFRVFHMPSMKVEKEFPNPFSEPITSIHMTGTRNDILFATSKNNRPFAGSPRNHPQHVIALNIDTEEVMGDPLSASAVGVSGFHNIEVDPDMTQIYFAEEYHLYVAKHTGTGWIWRKKEEKVFGHYRILPLRGGWLTRNGEFFDSELAELDLNIPRLQGLGVIDVITEIPDTPLLAGKGRRRGRHLTVLQAADAQSVWRSEKLPNVLIRNRDPRNRGTILWVSQSYDRVVYAPWHTGGLIVLPVELAPLVRSAPPVIRSPPVLTYTPGVAFHHSFTLLTGADVKSLTLVEGPEGASVDSAGNLRWTPPPTEQREIAWRVAVVDELDQEAEASGILMPKIPLLEVGVRGLPPWGLFDTDDAIDHVATEPGNPYAVFADDDELMALALGPQVLVNRRRLEARSSPVKLALREDTLYVGFTDELRAYRVPDLELLRVYPLNVSTLTDLSAPRNLQTVIYAGVMKPSFNGPNVGSLNLLDPRSGTSTNFEQTYTHVFRFSRDLSRLVGFNYDTSHFSWGGRPLDSFRTDSSEAGNLRTYKREGRALEEETRSRIGEKICSISLSPQSRMVSIVSKRARNTDAVVSHRDPHTLNELNLGLDLPEELQGFSHHPFFPLAIAWNKKGIRLFVLRPGEASTRELSIPDRMVLVRHVEWAGNGEKVFVYGESRDQRPLFFTLAPDFSPEEKAAFTRLPPLPDVVLPDVDSVRAPEAQLTEDPSGSHSESGLFLSKDVLEVLGRAVRNRPPLRERNLDDPAHSTDLRGGLLEVRSDGVRKGFGVLFSEDGLAILPSEVLETDGRSFTLRLQVPEGMLEFQSEVVAADPERGVVFARPIGTLAWPTFPLDFRSAPVDGDIVWFPLPEGGNDIGRIVSTERSTVHVDLSGVEAGWPLFNQKGNVVGLLREESSREGIYGYLPVTRFGESLRAVAKAARRRHEEGQP